MWIKTTQELSAEKDRAIFLEIKGNQVYGYEELRNFDTEETADFAGEIELSDEGVTTIKIAGQTITGNFYYQWDDVLKAETLGFSGFDERYQAVWLSQVR